jgi:hypothetical protein
VFLQAAAAEEPDLDNAEEIERLQEEIRELQRTVRSRFLHHRYSVMCLTCPVLAACILFAELQYPVCGVPHNEICWQHCVSLQRLVGNLGMHIVPSACLGRLSYFTTGY